jgi:TetR/AcrR family transcriptional regulator
MDNDASTEEKIFEAARAVFHEQGFDGARMQEIADRAGINKSMLHYYYRSKDKLFESVFQTSIEQGLLPILQLLGADLPLRDKIERFVHVYIDHIVAHPHVPAFVLHELRRHPDRLKQFAGARMQSVFPPFAAQIEAAVERGEIEPVRPEHVLVNMVGLCIFPFIARPMLEAVLGFDEEAFAAFVQERKQTVTAFLVQALGL